MSINKVILRTHETVNEHEDAYIIDVFSGMRFSTPFINYFVKQGKTMMNQVTKTDIIEASDIRGVGKDTAEKLYKVYIAYISKKLPANIDEELKGIPAGKVFENSSDKVLFIERYHSFNTLNLLELKNILISAAVLTGIRPTYIEEKFIQLLFDSSALNSNGLLIPLFLEENISPENKKLPIEYLKQFGLTDSELALLKKDGYIVLEDLINISFSLKLHRILKKYENFINQPFTSHFINSLNELSERDRKILFKKFQGNTLASIGRSTGFTRERLRQIVTSTSKQLMNSAEIAAEAIMLLKGKYSFNYEELKVVFQCPAEADYCCYMLKFQKKFPLNNISQCEH